MPRPTGKRSNKTSSSKSSSKKSPSKKSSPKTPTPRRWVAKVKTDSTHPPSGLFTKGAEEIARTLASRKVSPNGPASGMRMLTYFINRAGRGLSATRRAELQKAKALLSARIEREKKSDRKPAA